MKVDLVMWTYNGESTLDQVLTQIDRIIPEEYVGQKLIVDDGSRDETVSICESHGWKVIHNEGKGISDGANTALKNVRADYFASFEQDLLLSSDWWDSITSKLTAPSVAAASGVRFADKPHSLQNLQKYVYKKYIGEGKIPAWLRSRQFSSFTLGKTLDNTLWQTKALLKVGGFPACPHNAGIDTLLAYKFNEQGLKWIVDYNIKSVHIRKGGLKQELLHQYWYASSLVETWTKMKQDGVKIPINKKGIAFRTFTSPFTGVFVALKTRDPNIALVHPLIRLYYLRGLLKA